MERFTHSVILFYLFLLISMNTFLVYEGFICAWLFSLYANFFFLQHNLSLQTDLCDLSDTFGSS